MSGTLWDEACYTGMILGWGCLMRAGEYSKRDKYSSILKRKHITFSPNNTKPNEAFIELHKSKTNQFGKLEIINVPCICFSRTKKPFGNVKITAKHCPCCVTHHYVKRRDKFLIARDGHLDMNKPLLIKGNRKHEQLNYNNMSKWMSKCIDKINRNARLPRKLDRKWYPTHSLRLGGTTDMFRSGRSTNQIMRTGRWRTDQWRLSYLSSDFRDITLLSGLTQLDLTCDRNR